MTFPALDQLPAPPSGTVTVHVGAAPPNRFAKVTHGSLMVALSGSIKRRPPEPLRSSLMISARWWAWGSMIPSIRFRVKMLMRRGGVPIDEEFLLSGWTKL